MMWSSCNDGMAALDSSIDGDRDHSMVVATTIRATAAIAGMARRIIRSLRFPIVNLSGEPAVRFKVMLVQQSEAQRNNPAPGKYWR
jgi:hypothetical protein